MLFPSFRPLVHLLVYFWGASLSWSFSVSFHRLSHYSVIVQKQLLTHICRLSLSAVCCWGKFCRGAGTWGADPGLRLGTSYSDVKVLFMFHGENPWKYKNPVLLTAKINEIMKSGVKVWGSWDCCDKMSWLFEKEAKIRFILSALNIL